MGTWECVTNKSSDKQYSFQKGKEERKVDRSLPLIFNCPPVISSDFWMASKMMMMIVISIRRKREKRDFQNEMESVHE